MVLEHVEKRPEAPTDLRELVRKGDVTVCVMGLGYVGFPLAAAFSGKTRVMGFDISKGRLAALREKSPRELRLTSEPHDISDADFILICVPTPVTPSKEPDLSFVVSATETVGRNMRPGATVVLESTVYPGATEEVVIPVLERESGLVCGKDFKVGYSPERTNPGDDAHTLEKICKVVSGMDEETTDALVALYSHVTTPYRASSIRAAEAAKAIENVQRDLNIALMNELSMIFEKMGLRTKDVLDAAASKWNFVRFEPGMVGGHCIPVDPYYLVFKARELGHHCQVILAGRAINDHMPKHVAEMMIKGLNEAKKVIGDSNVLVAGLTYKANVPDVRESPARDLVKDLQEYGITVHGYDPLLSREELERFSVRPFDGGSPPMDGIIVTVSQDHLRLDLERLDRLMGPRPVLVDVKGAYDGAEATKRGYVYKCL